MHTRTWTAMVGVGALSVLLAGAPEGRAQGKAGAPGKGGAGQAPGVPFAPPPAAAAACPDDAWVGQLDAAASCPAALTDGAAGGAWTVAPLVDVGGLAALPMLQSAGPSMWGAVDALGRTCRYVWVPTVDGAKPRLDLLPAAGKGGGAWLERDCHVVVPMQGGTEAVADAAWDAIHTAYWARVGVTPGAPPVQANGAPVRLAIVDDRRNDPMDDLRAAVAVDALGPVGQLHGLAMRQLLVEATCTKGGTCAAEVSSHLALTLHPDDDGGPPWEDLLHGGTFGYRSRVATAIVDALIAWQQEAPGARLVLNLSLGWDPMHEPPGGSAGAAAVRSALELASCAGALILAAAGNDPMGSQAQAGAALPAAWEELPAPTACGAPTTWSTLAKKLWSTSGKYRPLVHAVGALGPDQRPIAISREGSTPRLLAPGFYALASIPWSGLEAGAWVDQPDGPGAAVPATRMALRRPLTGTSIATAVASALAALVWHQQPQLDAGGVADLLYATAHPLPPSSGVSAAEVCLGGPPCADVPRRLGAPYAVMTAKATTASAMTATAMTKAGAMPSPAGSIFSGSPDAVASADALKSAMAVPACGSTVWTAQTGMSNQHPCPSSQYYSGVAAPWAVDPQPGGDPCSVCALHVQLGAPPVLEIFLDPGLQDPVIGAMLTLEGGQVLSFDLGHTNPPLVEPPPGTTWRVELPAAAAAIGPIERATLDLALRGRDSQTYSALSELVVLGP